MNTTVIEDDVQDRLDAFFAIPLLELRNHHPFVAYDEIDDGEFESLRAIRYRNRRRRVDSERKEGVQSA